MRRSRLRGILLLLAICLPAVPAFAERRDAAVGASGETYTLRADLFGSLFPNGTGADPATPVLALDVARPGALSQRLLVPNTSGTSLAQSPSVLYEETGRTVFLLWETRVSAASSYLTLLSYDGANWSDPIKILGNDTLAVKTSPQMALTRDSYLDAGLGGPPLTRSRTILHVVWAESSPSGLDQVYYTPVVIADGAYVGENPVLNLNSFDQTPASPAVATPPALAHALSLAAGQDGRSVVATFASQLANRVLCVTISSLPRQLSRYADIMRAQVIAIGARLNYPANLPAMASQVGAAATRYGTDFQPEVVQTIAARLQAAVLGSAGTDLPSLAAGIRAVIIEIGVKLTGGGVRRGISQAAPAEVVEVGGGLENGDPAPSHYFSVQLASTRPLPSLAADAGAVDGIRMFPSTGADEVMLAWQGQGAVNFTSSKGSDWTPVFQLPLSDNLDAGRAYQLLEQKIR